MFGPLLLAPGPHPRRELTLMARLGFACPRLGIAAGASFFTCAGAPPPARTDADASPRIHLSSTRNSRGALLTLPAGPWTARAVRTVAAPGCGRVSLACSRRALPLGRGA